MNLEGSISLTGELNYGIKLIGYFIGIFIYGIGFGRVRGRDL